MLDEDDVKIAADAMKELEMFMPSSGGPDLKSSKKKYESIFSISHQAKYFGYLGVIILACVFSFLLFR